MSEQWIKIINNTGVLKMIQDCPRCKKREEDRKRRKVGNRDGTINTPNINTDITQSAIVAFHASQSVDNIIPGQVQIPHMGRKIGVNALSTNNDVSVTR